MRPSDPLSLTVWRQTAAGDPATSRVLADFTIPVYLDGAVQSLTWTVTEQSSSGAWRAYKLATTIPSSVGFLEIGPIQAALGSDLIAPDIFAGEIESYDTDALAALLQTSQGVPAVLSAADSDLGDIVDGDSYKSDTLTVPLGKMTALGQTTLAGLTLEAAIMGTPGGTSYPITATVVDATARTFTISWDTQQHPAMTTAESASWFIDVQLIKTGPPKLIATTNRYTFTQAWQRDTRTT